MNDQILLEWYWKGFTGELYGISSTESDDPILNKAYKLGSLHAWAGDDNRALDELSLDEILSLIKKENE